MTYRCPKCNCREDRYGDCGCIDINDYEDMKEQLNQEKQRREDAEKIIRKLAKDGVNLSVHTEAKNYLKDTNE